MTNSNVEHEEPTGTIRQSVHLSRTPVEVFDILMDSTLHATLIGVDCLVENRTGGSFRVGENMIDGVTLELEPGRRLVQTWRILIGGWPANHYSTLVLELSPEEGGTRATLVQTGVPQACIPVVEAGWFEYYWNPLGGIPRE